MFRCVEIADMRGADADVLGIERQDPLVAPPGATLDSLQ